MSTRINPAFPITEETVSVGLGLSKREYFAAAALTGLLANAAYPPCENADDAPDFATLAVAAADALIAELALELASDENPGFVVSKRGDTMGGAGDLFLTDHGWTGDINFAREFQTRDEAIAYARKVSAETIWDRSGQTPPMPVSAKDDQ